MAPNGNIDNYSVPLAEVSIVMATLHPNRFSQQLAGSPFLSQNVLSVLPFPCLLSIFLLSNLCLSYLLFSLCLSQIKKQTSEEQFIEVPHPLIIAAHHSRAVISNHDLQMFHLGASLFATSCTDFLLPHLSYYYFLHYFNDLSVSSHSRQGKLSGDTSETGWHSTTVQVLYFM